MLCWKKPTVPPRLPTPRTSCWIPNSFKQYACAEAGSTTSRRLCYAVRYGVPGPSRPRAKQIVVGIVTYVALYVVGVLALPYLFQTFVVKPNELSVETPYLNHYIDFTRKAYKLDGIQETAYPALTDLTPEVIARNQDTIQNIRLWDSRPLLQTYQQTQAIRLYYEFYNVDVDRYRLPDGYHQVMLASDRKSVV